MLKCIRAHQTSFSLSVSLSHTRTHTHTHFFTHPLRPDPHFRLIPFCVSFSVGALGEATISLTLSLSHSLSHCLALSFPLSLLPLSSRSLSRKTWFLWSFITNRSIIERPVVIFSTDNQPHLGVIQLDVALVIELLISSFLIFCSYDMFHTD